MKRALAGYFATTPPGSGARVLFKFGDNHMGKGFNGLGQRDLGNFVAERAEGEGATSLHMIVVGAKGIHALYNGVGRQVRQEPFVMSDDKDYAWISDVLAARSKSLTANDWLVIDLRSLRDGPTSDMTTQWRELIRRYDIVVLAPALTPSNLVGIPYSPSQCARPSNSISNIHTANVRPAIISTNTVRINALPVFKP